MAQSETKLDEKNKHTHILGSESRVKQNALYLIKKENKKKH